MSNFKLTFYEACFHTIEVEAHDAAEAEQIARSCINAKPDTAKTNSRGLVRWHVEPAAEAEAGARASHPSGESDPAVTPGCPASVILLAR
jgi:hypothetical protein